jgi:hypothetical protein
MRASQLATNYFQAIVFAVLGLRCVTAYARERDRRSAHLAWAAGLFGLSSLISAVTSTIWDQTLLEEPPRIFSIMSSVIIFLSVYAFLRFLSDFIAFPKWLHPIVIAATAVNIGLAVIERPDIRFDPQRGIVPIPGIDNPISFRAYIGYVLIYLAVAFGVLALAFAVYGLRTSGLARFRMLSIAAGFFLLFVVIGLLPRLLFGNPSAETIRTISDIVRYVALFSAPLLFVGFAPPEWVRRRVSGGEPSGPPLDRKVRGAA